MLASRLCELLDISEADVVKAKGRSEKSLEQSSGSERDTHFFVGNLRLQWITRFRFLSVTGRSIWRLPVYVFFLLLPHGLPFVRLLVLRPVLDANNAHSPGWCAKGP